MNKVINSVAVGATPCHPKLPGSKINQSATYRSTMPTTQGRDSHAPAFVSNCCSRFAIIGQAGSTLLVPSSGSGRGSSLGEAGAGSPAGAAFDPAKQRAPL